MTAADAQPKQGIISARKGHTVHLQQGQRLRLINTHGTQVIDLWALNAHDLKERMSMEHSRAYLNKLYPSTNDTFVTNRRSPILTISADTTNGTHDMLMPSCDIHRYQKQYGVEGYHDNCSDNLRNELVALGEEWTEHVWSPFNAFMNIKVKGGNDLSWEKTAVDKGQYVEFRAEMDLVMIFSACPNDVMPINGGVSRDAEYVILDGKD